MAKLGELMVVVDADDRLTPKLHQVEKSIGNTARAASTQRAAFRSMAYGLSSLGTMAVGLGVALQKSNDETVKSIGNTIMLAGSLLSGLSAVFQFTVAIQRMTKAWKDLTTAQIIAKAFSGPAGWATLAVGGAIAAGTVMAVSKVGQSSKAGTTVINNNIAGSVVTERQIAEINRRQIVKTADRNYSSGIK